MSKRSEKLRGEVGIFLKEYARKAQKGVEPNDRGYDRKLEHEIKHMNPEELSELMSGDESGLDPELESIWFEGKEIEGVEFVLNQPVGVVSGASKGLKASVLSLLQVEPEVRYYVELESGESIGVIQTQLAKL